RRWETATPTKLTSWASATPSSTPTSGRRRIWCGPFGSEGAGRGSGPSGNGALVPRDRTDARRRNTGGGRRRCNQAGDGVGVVRAAVERVIRPVAGVLRAVQEHAHPPPFP